MTINLKKICGIDFSEFKVKSLCQDEITKAFCESTGLFQAENEAENVIILDNESLDYAPYAIEIGKNVTIKGSYRSIEKAIEIFYSLLQKENLTEVDSICGAIDLPKIPYNGREDLLKIVQYMYDEDDRILFGQHMGGSTDPEDTINEYTEAAGVGPSIIDFDMLTLRIRPRCEWSRTLCELVEFASKGGIITTMHHWANPNGVPEGVQSFRGHLGNNEAWLDVLTPGTKNNKLWVEELDRGGEFMNALWKCGVTVMWRPLHEANGSWFWFCQGQGEEFGNITPENMVKMWIYVYDYYTKHWGLNQLVWSYGPNVSNNLGPTASVKYYYPGDKYVDVVGFDWYTNNRYEFDAENYDGKCHDRLIEYGKPFGIMEWGINSEIRDNKEAGNDDYFTCEDYCKILNRMKAEGKKCAFAEVYNSIYGSVKYVGKAESLYKSGCIVALHEMPALIKKILNK